MFVCIKFVQKCKVFWMVFTQNVPYYARKVMSRKTKYFSSLFDFLCLCSKFYLAQFTDIFSVKNWETKLDRNWISLYWPPQHFTPSHLQSPATFLIIVLTNNSSSAETETANSDTPRYLIKLSQRKQLLRVVMKVK